MLLKISTFLALTMAWCLADETTTARPRFLPEISLAGMPYRQIELAVTEAELRRGLMDRTYLADDGGMLFFYGRPKFAAFWMKNTRIPLDVLFLDEQGTILQVATMAVEPPQAPGESDEAYEARLKSYLCLRPATCALEIAAGRAAELGLAPGSRIPGLALRVLLQNIMAIQGSEGNPPAYPNR